MVASIAPCHTPTRHRHPPGYVQKHTQGYGGTPESPVKASSPFPAAGTSRQSKDLRAPFERVTLGEEDDSDHEASNGNANTVNGSSGLQPLCEIQRQELDFLRHNAHEKVQSSRVQPSHSHPHQYPTLHAGAMPLTQDFRRVGERNVMAKDLVTDLGRQCIGADLQQQQQQHSNGQLRSSEFKHPSPLAQGHHLLPSNASHHGFSSARDVFMGEVGDRGGYEGTEAVYGGGTILQQPQSVRPRYGQVEGLTLVECREMSPLSALANADKTRGIVQPIHNQKSMETDNGGIYQENSPVFRSAPHLMPLPPPQNPLAEPNGRQLWPAR